MIGYIKGEVVVRTATHATILLGSGRDQIGYDVQVGALPGLERTNVVGLWCWQTVGDSANLFGFATAEAKELAQLIANKVAGVGPSTAHKMLTTTQPQDLIRLILAGDPKQIQKACKGVGPKTAEAMISSLKGLVVQTGGGSSNVPAACQVLAAMGIEPSAPVLAAMTSCPADTNTADLVSVALKVLRG